ncbi:MAG: helix-turn-helix domain-containing protein [Caloramator sp.]|nr:helix-turn-helix domain-containing protein [Caloramator sp.]
MPISILGQNIKKIREEKGISAYKLSKIAGVGISTISEIENGKRQSLNSSTIEKVANALNVSVDDLLLTEDNKEYPAIDIFQTINTILTSDELLLDDIPLSKTEKSQIKKGINALFDIIRIQRGDEI